jgi:hypothetical protein
MSPRPLKRFTTGFPSTNDQRYASSDPSSRRTSTMRLALVTADSIFIRLRTIEASSMSRSILAGVNRATFAASNPANARRYPSRLWRIVDHESPDCAPSSTSISKRCPSSCDGTPHSASWYSRYAGSVVLAHAQRTRSFDGSGVRLGDFAGDPTGMRWSLAGGGDAPNQCRGRVRPRCSPTRRTCRARCRDRAR